MTENNEKKEDRRYLVMADSHRPYDKTVLARIKPLHVSSLGYWTDKRCDELWIVTAEEADEILKDLGFNSPRKVRLEKALALLDAQHPGVDAAPKEPADETPSP